MYPKLYAAILLSFLPLQHLSAGDDGTVRTDTVWIAVPDSIRLDEVELRERRHTTFKPSFTTENVEVVSAGELVRAACCNLGESFTTNPSVDVSYSDAATGARQIRLLGLSGTYVQMLAENVPTLRGAAMPLSLGFVPGPWMQSIQVSKGASSVKNGYESIAGQINIEYLKPQGIDGVHANAYYDTDRKLEANAVGTIHLTDRLSTGVLAHYETRQMEHDGNGDGFIDMPRVEQFNLMDRWAWVSSGFISQLSVRGLHESRHSGQTDEGAAANRRMTFSPSGTGLSGGLFVTVGNDPYRISMKTDRVEATWKNAVITDAARNASVALIVSGSWHDAENTIGGFAYDVTQRNGYAQLMYESDFGKYHNLSVGLSLNTDRYDEHLKVPYAVFSGIDPAQLPPVWLAASEPVARQLTDSDGLERETTVGAYAQYTFKLGDRFTAMAGLRADRSTLWGTFLTPRVHLKYTPAAWVTLRASAGKGYRTPHVLAENVTLLAANRWLSYTEACQEEAWNAGLSASLTLPLGHRTLSLNAEYYYTTFRHQMVTDTDHRGWLLFYDVARLAGGKSDSHVVQVDASYPLFEGFTLTAAWRMQDVHCAQLAVVPPSGVPDFTSSHLRTVPLQSRYKALLTASYKTPLELWQFDVTCQLNGPGRLPDSYGENGTDRRYRAFALLSAQVTREFRYFSLYAGGENLTGFRQKTPVVHAASPWTDGFDATCVYGPVTGVMGYVGLRFNFE